MLTGGVSRFHPDPVAVLEVAAKHIRDHNRINHRDSNLGVDVGALVAVAKYLSLISKRPVPKRTLSATTLTWINDAQRLFIQRLNSLQIFRGF